MNLCNLLSIAEAERLDMLQEEASEIIKACAKIKRHGYNNFNPDNPDAGTNKDQLERELLDLDAIVLLMMVSNDMDSSKTMEDAVNVLDRKSKYMHFQNAALAKFFSRYRAQKDAIEPLQHIHK